MSKKSAYFFSLIFFVFIAHIAQASQMPRYLGTEKKFRSYIYNPNDVYRYIGHYTYQGFIELEEGETVGTISMGNPTLWLFEHLGNRLFLKPVGEDNSETNMTVITNKRVYHFELVAKEAKGISDKDLIFVAKFVYPDEKDKNIVEFSKSNASDEPDMRDLTLYNFNYQYTGEHLIAPIKVFDNDEFTYFQFSKKNAEVPAIFSVDAAGYESLVNFRSAGSYIIVERVSPQFTLRSGNDIVCVYNTSLYSDGRPKTQTSLKNRNDKNPPPMVDFSTPTLNQAPNSTSNFPPNYGTKNSSPNSTQAPMGAPSSLPPGMPAGMPGMMGGGAPDDFEMPKTSKMPKLPGDPY
jgi:type IV secretion system protein VirB9